MNFIKADTESVHNKFRVHKSLILYLYILIYVMFVDFIIVELYAPYVGKVAGKNWNMYFVINILKIKENLGVLYGIFVNEGYLKLKKFICCSIFVLK